MKKIVKFAGLWAALLFALPACDVTRLPETSISDETYWNNESDLRFAANYMYTFIPGWEQTMPNNTMPGWSTEDVWSDDAYGTAPNPISDGSRLAPSTDAGFSQTYRLIRAANNIIEKAPRAAKTTSTAVINRYIAEARFFRGWGYFLLVQRYGQVPMVLTTLTDQSPELYKAAATREELYQQIYSDLDYAAATLPSPTTLGTADYGRISNTAALAMKARAALFEGTRAKFHKYGDPTTHLNTALAAARAVMDGKQHDLFGDYFNLFQLAGEGRQNRENILVRQYGVSSADRVVTHNYFRAILEVGPMNPTKALADSYLLTDGLPMGKSPLYTMPTASVDVFKNRDTRMSATFFKRGDRSTPAKPVFDIAPIVFNRTGFAFRKASNFDDWNTSASTIDRPIIRYAEMLLIIAEATYELNGNITDALLDQTINRLRARGGVAKLTNAFVTANGLDMREEIRRERRVEFAQEGFRYWDLIRWKTAEIELPKAVLGNYFFKSEFGTSTAVLLTPDNYILVQNASTRKFDPARDYLFPIPLNEISLNDQLKQNPGW